MSTNQSKSTQTSQENAQLIEASKGCTEYRVYNKSISNVNHIFINLNDKTFVVKAEPVFGNVRLISASATTITVCDKYNTYILDLFSSKQVEFDPIILLNTDTKEIMQQKLKHMTAEEYLNASRIIKNYVLLDSHNLTDEVVELFRTNVTNVNSTRFSSDLHIMKKYSVQFCQILLGEFVKNRDAYYAFHDIYNNSTDLISQNEIKHIIRDTIFMLSQGGQVDKIKLLGKLL